MYRLRRLNVERITESEHARDRYIKQGYELVVEQQAAEEEHEEAQEPEEPVEHEKSKGSRNNKKAAQ